MNNNTAQVLVVLGILAAGVTLIVNGHGEGVWLFVILFWAIFL